VGLGGLGPLRRRLPAGGRRRGLVRPQPALQGAGAGHGQVRLGALQLHADVAGAPAGVLLPQGEDVVPGRVGRGRRPGAAGVLRGEGVGLLAEPLQEVADGPHRQGEVGAKPLGGPAAEVEFPQALAHGQGGGLGHGIPRSPIQRRS
jgi:hypothetical protein